MSVTLGAGSAVQAETGSTFTDVRGHWAAQAIQEMSDRGIVQGFPDGTFRPDAVVTEEQFMSLVERMLPEYAGHPLDDFVEEMYLQKVEGRWSEAAYRKLLVAGIIGYEEPAAGISRMAAARILLTALASQSEGEKYRNANERLFSDVPLEEYEKMTIYPVVKLGVMSGFPDGTFRPQEKVTRAQAVVLLSRLEEKMAELYPDNLDPAAKRAAVASVKDVINRVMQNKEIKSFEQLKAFVRAHQLPVSDAFLEEHFFFLKLEAGDYAAFPRFDELVYVTKTDDNKIMVKVQYYSGELAGSIDKTFYLTSADGKPFRLIGKNE